MTLCIKRRSYAHPTAKNTRLNTQMVSMYWQVQQDWFCNRVIRYLSVHTTVWGEGTTHKWTGTVCCCETHNKSKHPTTTCAYMHACSPALLFLPPCTASGESSLYSRHREMSAPCDRPVSSRHTDLCGTSLSSLFLLWWRDYVCSHPIKSVYSASNGGPLG